MRHFLDQLSPHSSGQFSVLLIGIQMVMAALAFTLLPQPWAVLIPLSVFIASLPFVLMLHKWSDCPECGRSSFRYPAGTSFWKSGGRKHDIFPVRECEGCGARLDVPRGSV